MKQNGNSLARVFVVIPAFNPDNRLIQLVEDLIVAGYEHVFIVDDGSDLQTKEFFKKLESKTQTHILVHKENKGKGCALKTGFQAIQNLNLGEVGVVTADADGQHSCEDILRITKKLIEDPDKMILGARSFSKQDIPLRSRLGNMMTRKIFSFLTGIKISDTQTGLRGFPSGLLPYLLKVGGKKYEYETNVLLACKQYDIDIEEVSIQTIYIDENKSSHFNPLTDSIKIYAMFFKFVSSSLLSFLIDILLFTLFVHIFNKSEYYVMIATICARILSSLFNYLVNRKVVFNQGSKGVAFIKYYILCLGQMLISGLSVSMINVVIINSESLIKIVIDCLLSIISFKLQKEWVFKLNKKDIETVVSSK